MMSTFSKIESQYNTSSSSPHGRFSYKYSNKQSPIPSSCILTDVFLSQDDLNQTIFGTGYLYL